MDSDDGDDNRNNSILNRSIIQNLKSNINSNDINSNDINSNDINSNIKIFLNSYKILNRINIRSIKALTLAYLCCAILRDKCVFLRI